MKVTSVIKEGDWQITHDPNYEPCGKQGLHTIHKVGSHVDSGFYHCYFPAALECLAEQDVSEDLPIEDRHFLIKLKINDMLSALPEEWKKKWNPKYKLISWKTNHKI